MSDLGLWSIPNSKFTLLYIQNTTIVTHEAVQKVVAIFLFFKKDIKAHQLLPVISDIFVGTWSEEQFLYVHISILELKSIKRWDQSKGKTPAVN